MIAPELMFQMFHKEELNSVNLFARSASPLLSLASAIVQAQQPTVAPQRTTAAPGGRVREKRQERGNPITHIPRVTR
jgi:hypothetical protein